MNGADAKIATRTDTTDAAVLLSDASMTSVHDGGFVTMDASQPSLPPAMNRNLPIVTEPHLGEAPYFNVTRPADLSALGIPLPVVVWANGGCLRSDFTWAPLFERWAAAGFVVLSLSAEGGDAGPGGLLGMLGTTGETEHRALIDWVVANNAAGPYAAALDLGRVVLAGNSCGGVTALQSAAEDHRAAAVFVLSGSSAIGSVDTNVMKAITVPVGYVIGGDEDIAGVNAKGDFAAMNPDVPAMVINRRVGDHLTVSTDSTVLPQDAEMALEWMDLALYGTEEAYEALTSKNVCSVCTPGDWTLTARNLETLRR